MGTAIEHVTNQALENLGDTGEDEVEFMNIATGEEASLGCNSKLFFFSKGFFLKSFFSKGFILKGVL